MSKICRKEGLELRKNLPGYLLMAPAVIAILALSVYPLFRGIYLSFLNYNLVRPNDPAFNTFAGLQNYIDIFKDKVFIQSIGNTVKWTVINLVVQLVAAMLLALALNQKLKGRSVYRTLILVPWAVPHAIAAMTFTFLYNANVGIINILAVKLGMITESVSWLGNVGSAFWCVVLVAIWKGIPFQMIFILAALQGISGDVYESAEIDGASRWQCFWKITLPIIKEPLAISTILNLIGIVSCFNTIWLMTKGGPLYSTEIIYTYAYRRAFIDHNFGTAAAASVVLFIFMAVFSGVYLKMVSEKEEGGGNYMHTKQRNEAIRHVVAYIFTIVMVFLAVTPFIYVVLTALKTKEQIYDLSQIIPTHITFDNFRQVLFQSNFVRYFMNSIFITLVTTLICMILSVMAAYGLTRYRIVGAGKIKMAVLMTRMFPGILLCIPYYIIMKQLNLIDSYIGLILMYCSFTLPFAIWNTCAFFISIPWELEEAARIDGCSRLKSFFHVIIHVAKPGLFVTALFCFMTSWDEYMYASIFINTTLKKTIQVGMQDFVGQYSVDWGLLMSAVVISLIPILIFFALVQKNLVQGLSAGAVKG